MSEGIKKFRREHCLNPERSEVEFESDWVLLYLNEPYLSRAESVLEERVLG